MRTMKLAGFHPYSRDHFGLKIGGPEVWKYTYITRCAGTCLPLRDGERGYRVGRILLCWDPDKPRSRNGQNVTDGRTADGWMDGQRDVSVEILL